MSLTREHRLTFGAAGVDTADRAEGADLVVEMAFASEAPYERWWGIEILDCSPEAVDLSRLNDGGALLYNHNWDDLRGHHVPGSVRADADRVIRGQVAISHAVDAGRTIALVEGSHLTKTSTGYEIFQVVEKSTAKGADAPLERTLDGRLFDRVLTRSQRDAPGDLAAFRRALDAEAGPFERAADQPATYVVTRWGVLENSLVTVPADPSVGLGRTAKSAPLAHPAVPATPISILETNMTTEVVDVAAVERDATTRALKRINDIAAMGEQFKDFDGVKTLAEAAIRTGQPVEEFTTALLKHISEKSKPWTPEIGMSDKEVKRFSVVRAINAMLSNDWSEAGLEREASVAFADKAQKAGLQRQASNSFFLPVEVQKRDLTVGTATAGGNMVATDLRPQDFIELLRSRTLISQLGARSLTGLVGNADITRQTGAGTAYWLANESTAITESNQTVGLLQLRPKVLGAYTEVSRLLLQQSTPDADMFVMDDLTKVIAIAKDAAAINTGGSGAPVGILGTAGIGSVTGTTLGLAGILEFQTDVATANALSTQCAYLTTPLVAALLAQRQRFSGTDTPLWDGNILDGNVIGFRGASTTQIPAATMIFGDFSQVIFAEWGAVEIAANPFANFPAGITGIRAFYTCDVGVRTAGAFSAASTIT